MLHRRTLAHVLEELSNESLKQWNKHSSDIKDYVYQNYSYYAQKRAEIFSFLKEALLSECKEHALDNWQRSVSFKHSLNPLSTQGSLNNPIGGRFNIGNIEPTLFPPFGALYLAEDRDTAIREKHAIPSANFKNGGLSSNEITLIKKESETHVVVSGNIVSVLDLSTKKSLEKFFKHIREIKTPTHLFNMARKLKIPLTFSVSTLKQLYETIFEEDWRQHSTLCRIPSNSQILGQIAYEAGVEGILYPSTKDGKRCLAVYPNNFQNSNSCLQINKDHSPTELNQDLFILNKQTFKNFL